MQNRRRSISLWWQVQPSSKAKKCAEMLPFPPTTTTTRNKQKADDKRAPLHHKNIPASSYECRLHTLQILFGEGRPKRRPEGQGALLFLCVCGWSCRVFSSSPRLLDSTRAFSKRITIMNAMFRQEKYVAFHSFVLGMYEHMESKSHRHNLRNKIEMTLLSSPPEREGEGRSGLPSVSRNRNGTITLELQMSLMDVICWYSDKGYYLCVDPEGVANNWKQDRFFVLPPPPWYRRLFDEWTHHQWEYNPVQNRHKSPKVISVVDREDAPITFENRSFACRYFFVVPSFQTRMKDLERHTKCSSSSFQVTLIPLKRRFIETPLGQFWERFRNPHSLLFRFCHRYL
uniref:Uncharacterized protein n=1 Tax=Palpitomonas bilix TaxID=652834 RepID=A0A7S3FZ97_9EUKA|mmetsp:Transcript_15679/g.39823  ORF Transcript_15679/g.39823 Transcript_15679/m.39823 type:complete len:343 (+) Transcript_15679:469-1497(+)